MCHVQVLGLTNNKISDAGLTAFAKAVESGALPQLKELYLGGCENLGLLPESKLPYTLCAGVMLLNYYY